MKGGVEEQRMENVNDIKGIREGERGFERERGWKSSSYPSPFPSTSSGEYGVRGKERISVYRLM